MLNYLKNFLNDFKYEKTDADILLAAYRTIEENEEAFGFFQEILSAYNQNMNTSWSKQMERMNTVAKQSGLHIYTVSLVACICLTGKLKDYYNENGLSYNLWYDTILDLKYKLKECKLVKGICGIFACGWYGSFFVLNLFAFGRLQFKINRLRYDYNKDGLNLKVGDDVVDIHIPRTEAPLDRASCIDSYSRAKDFFTERFINKPMPFVCSSWLLAEENKSMLSEKSNIRQFMDDFEIISTSYSDEGDYSEAWRLFDMDFTGNLDDFPEDSSFRRAYKNYLKAGGRIGSSYGIFIM